MNELRGGIENILSRNQQDWETRFYGYYEKIINNGDMIDQYRKKFHMRGFLRAYMSFGQAMRQNPVFSLRYGGQIIGFMKFKKSTGEPYLSINEKCYKDNLKWFNFNLLPPKENRCQYIWKSSPEAQKFRNRFESSLPPKVGQDEHRFETFILDEMLNPTGDKFCGTLRDIRPVCIADRIPFQMPMPIRARGGKPEYTPTSAGHIDILARYGRGKPVLTVIELKRPDGEYKGAAKQAFIYTVALTYMFTKTSIDFRKKLCALCGYKVYPKLRFNAVVAIPFPYLDKYKQEISQLQPLKDKDISLRYIAYKIVDNHKIEIIGQDL